MQKKKLDKMRDQEKDLNKKIEQLQKDLKENQENQQSQARTIESEKEKLNELRMRRS